MSAIGRVLIVAGSDCGGGAGIQADIKTVTALGGYAATAVTALTVQDTTGVHGVHTVPTDIIAAQMKAVLADIGADAVKTGMLHDNGVIHTVCDVIEAQGGGARLVVDPVMVAKGGAKLLDPDASDALRGRLVPMADLVTPNAPELAALTGMAVRTDADLERAGEALLAAGARAVLAKGGHLEGQDLVDILLTAEGSRRFSSPRIDTRHTHGTGCTLASAIAVRLAQGAALDDAVAAARAYVHEAIRTAPGLGRGHGPLNHGHTLAGSA